MWSLLSLSTSTLPILVPSDNIKQAHLESKTYWKPHRGHTAKERQVVLLDVFSVVCAGTEGWNTLGVAVQQ